MITAPLLLEETNLSTAWTRVFEHILKGSGKEITPLILTLTDFEESTAVRHILDEHLLRNEKAKIQTVAGTIFPNDMYTLCEEDRHTLYKEYLDILPRIKKLDKKNKGGTYFERLIAYNGKVNQLEIIISAVLKDKSVRRSALQASIFDPSKDHTNLPYQGFPCLQHVTFYITPNDGLIVNSFYAVQYLYERAYGNWLGLINLGRFMANELQIKLERFNCYIGVEQLDYLTKADGNKLLETIKQVGS